MQKIQRLHIQEPELNEFNKATRYKIKKKSFQFGIKSIISK
jgi:hypothetical protein